MVVFVAVQRDVVVDDLAVASAHQAAEGRGVDHPDIRHRRDAIGDRLFGDLRTKVYSWVRDQKFKF